MTDEDPIEVAELSFDDALSQLEQLAQQLEAGDIALEDSLRVYERAVALFRHCSDRLTGVEQRLEVLNRDLDGVPVSRPLEATDEAPEDG